MKYTEDQLKQLKLCAIYGITLCDEDDLSYVNIEDVNETINCIQFYGYKPVFKSMSRLDKTMNIDGFSFVPLEVLYESHKDEFSTYEEFADVYYNLYLEPLKHSNWNDLQQMIKWGFDVFGLITINKAKEDIR